LAGWFSLVVGWALGRHGPQHMEPTLGPWGGCPPSIPSSLCLALPCPIVCLRLQIRHILAPRHALLAIRPRRAAVDEMELLAPSRDSPWSLAALKVGHTRRTRATRNEGHPSIITTLIIIIIPSSSIAHPPEGFDAEFWKSWRHHPHHPHHPTGPLPPAAAHAGAVHAWRAVRC